MLILWHFEFSHIPVHVVLCTCMWSHRTVNLCYENIIWPCVEGRVISAYRRPDDRSEWEELGKGNPQWPQAFYPMDHTRTISPRDIIAGRCIYNSTTRDTSTHMQLVAYWLRSNSEFTSNNDCRFIYGVTSAKMIVDATNLVGRQTPLSPVRSS